MERKALSAIEWKSGKAGAFKAVVATYNVVDHDGDVILPGALDTPRPVVVSPWNHSTVDEANADMPVGTATITTVGDQAIAEGHYFMNTPLGKQAYDVTKALFDDGLGEWSFAFKIPQGGAMTDANSLKDWPGAQRILAKTTPFEVSLVFAGAGIGTQTLSVKSLLEKRGARLSKESIARLHTLRDLLNEFIGESEGTDEPKQNDAELQSFLRTARDDVDRRRASRLIDLRAI